jgi:hypothetical protein
LNSLLPIHEASPHAGIALTFGIKEKSSIFLGAEGEANTSLGRRPRKAEQVLDQGLKLVPFFAMHTSIIAMKQNDMIWSSIGNISASPLHWNQGFLLQIGKPREHSFNTPGLHSRHIFTVCRGCGLGQRARHGRISAKSCTQLSNGTP